MAEGHGGDVRAYRQPNTLTEAERAELVRRYNAGEAVAAIAEAFGLSEGSASKLAHDAGCPRRQVRGKVARPADFDPAKLAVVEWEGEPRVVDTVLGAALGYEKPHRLRELIARKLPVFQGTGKLPRRAEVSSQGKRGPAPFEFLLNREQVNLAILLCGLPNVDGIKAHVAKVFTAWEEGRLKAADLETAVALQDSAEAAAVSAPAVAAFKEHMLEAAKDAVRDAVRQAVKEELPKIIKDAVPTRRDPTSATKRLHIKTVQAAYSGVCPCCRKVRVVNNGALTAEGNFDHKTDHPQKNAAHETWLVCSSCNNKFASGAYLPERRDAQFVAYQQCLREIAEEEAGGVQLSLLSDGLGHQLP